jgi:hypothetical protein
MTPDFFTKSTIVSEYSTSDYMKIILKQIHLLIEYRETMIRMFSNGRVNITYVRISKEIHRLEYQYMELHKKEREFNTIGDAC